MLYDYASDDGSQHASLYRDVIEGLRESVSTHHAVSIVSLDDFIGNRALAPVDLLKIDVEGNELEVLRGARQSLQKGTIQAIQFEFNEMNLVSRVFFKDFLDMLRGYRLFRLLPRGMLPVQPYHPVLHELFGYQNIVAFRKGATAPGLSFPEERDLL